ncbi:hypothetical protein IAU59_005669 [Kwoniella sp. CBS 9459]
MTDTSAPSEQSTQAPKTDVANESEASQSETSIAPSTASGIGNKIMIHGGSEDSHKHDEVSEVPTDIASYPVKGNAKSWRDPKEPMLSDLPQTSSGSVDRDAKHEGWHGAA